MDFYYMLLSAPCRAAMMTAKAVDQELNLKHIDLLKGEQMKPEFLAVNPQHCVPTLVDGDLTLWESRAVCAYLANKYGKDELYPKDPKTRAMVDRLLYFDMGSLYGSYMKYAYPSAFNKVAPVPENLEKLHGALATLESYLSKSSYAVGDNITIADHSLAASAETIRATGVDFSAYPNTCAWMARCNATVPGYASNLEGAEQFGGFVKNALSNY